MSSGDFPAGVGSDIAAAADVPRELDCCLSRKREDSDRIIRLGFQSVIAKEKTNSNRNLLAKILAGDLAVALFGAFNGFRQIIRSVRELFPSLNETSVEILVGDTGS